jgi:hypothetical protein
MNFECACETLLDFVERLERGDLIVGERLRTRRTEKDRVLRVVERVQCALSREGSLGGGRVAQIEEPCVEFVE